MIDAVDVIRLVGPQAFGKAREIVRLGLVDDCVWDPSLQLLTARVESSDPRHADDDPYEVRVDLLPAAGEFVRPDDSRCSCPLRGDCKHVAAALLALSARAIAEQSARAGGPVGSAARVAAPAAGSADPDPDWRLALARLAGDAPETAAARHATPLGLQFELRQIARRTRLGVRPVTKSAKGNWVRGQLTWQTLPYSVNKLGLDHAQHAWFLQFQALHRSGLITGVPGESEWLHLDDFASPLLWPLLAEGARLGIDLVVGKDSAGVTVTDDARLVLDAGRTEASLSVRAVALLDGRTAQPGTAGTIGDHGLYSYRESPSFAVTLGPTPTPIPDDQKRLLVDRERIVVPDSGVDEFLTEWGPKLRGRTDLVSSDGSVELPGTGSQELVLTVRFEPGDVVHLTWRWHLDGRRDPVTMHGPVPDSATFPEPPDGVTWFADATLEGDETAAFSAETLPLLQQRDDLRVAILGERPPYERLTEMPTLHMTTVESIRRDWFDMSFVVTIQGRLVPFVDLMTAIGKRNKRLRLIDRSYVLLSDPMFDRLKDLVDEARELAEWEPGTPFRISPVQAGLWSEFDQLADESVQDDRWRQVAGGLLEYANASAGTDASADPSAEPAYDDVSVPESVVGELRPYQRQGFSWLTFLAEHGLGGVLADDMGLGKTLQTLAMIAHQRALHPDAPPFLVVAPTSVVGNWAAEAARFVPSLDVRVVPSTSVRAHDVVASAFDGADVVVTSYALLRLDSPEYVRREWAGLILDEAQFVKNPVSQAHRVAVDLRAPVKYAITGTPLENGLADLWALFRIVAPGLLSSFTRFTEDYVKPLGSDDLVGDARAALTERLRKRIRPLMLRRTKEAVASDLPPKQEQTIDVPLEPAHRDLYDATLNRERLKLLDLVDDLDQHRMTVFRSLTLLRMMALSPALVSDEHAEIPSAKLDLLLDELDELAAEGRRALVFSQFTSFLRLVADALDRRGVAYEYLDGSTRQRDRVIDRFRNGDAPAFLISLKAGGFGLNLTEADTVFVLDPWWNPAAEEQAIDRTHRIGQTRSVTVVRLIAEDTIEEKVLALAAKKSELFDAMIDDDALFAGALTATDIRALLA
jgi:superfamily II DNA or RNA helicase